MKGRYPLLLIVVGICMYLLGFLTGINTRSVTAAQAETTPEPQIKTIDWSGQGPADPNCQPGQPAVWHFVLTTGGNNILESGQMTANFSNGTSNSDTGEHKGGNRGAMHFYVTTTAPATVVSAVVTFTYSGEGGNFQFVISDTECRGPVYTPISTPTKTSVPTNTPITIPVTETPTTPHPTETETSTPTTTPTPPQETKTPTPTGTPPTVTSTPTVTVTPTPPTVTATLTPTPTLTGTPVTSTLSPTPPQETETKTPTPTGTPPTVTSTPNGTPGTTTPTPTETVTSTPTTPPTTTTPTPTVPPSTSTPLPKPGRVESEFMLPQLAKSGVVQFAGQQATLHRSTQTLSMAFGWDEALIYDNMLELHLNDQYGRLKSGWILANLTPGRRLWLTENHSTRVFEVTRVYTIPREEFEKIMSSDADLVGFTCWGSWDPNTHTYDQYRVVEFREVQPLK